MGVRYYIDPSCSYCGYLNKECYISPTSGFITFTCEKCGKESFVRVELNTNTFSKKLEETNYNDIYNSIEESANFMGEDQIESYSKQLFNEIRSKINEEGGTKMADETDVKEPEPSEATSEPETTEPSDGDDEDDEIIEIEDDDSGEEEVIEEDTDNTESTESE